MSNVSTSAGKTRFLVLSGVIAALYAALTYAAAALNLAYGPVQFRFSEALTVLPAFTPAAVPGLAVGCFLSNLASPLGVVDWVFGTGATLLAALGTWAVSRVCYKGVPVLAPVPPVIANALIVGLEVSCLSESGAFSWGAFSPAAFAAGALSVGLGELVVCFALGLPLAVALEKTGAAKMLRA
ncbi:QueT transporter family protein [Acutalibacter caecimuris]|uniref:QueT transporter family protein n=1 Tax=Acutalibacter caecimuris TaxID=3093657 RepID=UPI002AC8CB59|nr:QueT transporter family protein [Acutalibacter sp. M00118]